MHKEFKYQAYQVCFSI
uniref:Uncharacterized protein n=1 Tax=Rhizophora mucronata TaxID=61149 RepID=A0A2P2N534_RHIMU